MEFEAMVKIASETNNISSRGLAIFAQLELMVIFKDWKCATKILIEADNLHVSIPGHFLGFLFTTLKALIFFKATQALPFY